MAIEGYLHVPPGETIVLRGSGAEHESPAALADFALGIATELWPEIRPLATDLWLACRSMDVPSVESDVSPRKPAWHIREEQLPEFVEIPWYGGPEHEFEVVPELTVAALRDWVLRALAQEPPAPGYLVTFSGLSCDHARARIHDQDSANDADSIAVRDGGTVIRVPLERRPDGFWAVGPIRSVGVNPPVSYEVTCEGAVPRAQIRVQWSRWSQPGSREHEELENALQRIVGRGWTAELVPEGFALRESFREAG